MAGLDAAALAADFERDGFCVIPNALSLGALLKLQAAFTTGLEASGARAEFEAAGRQNEKGQRILGLPREQLLLGDDCACLCGDPRWTCSQLASRPTARGPANGLGRVHAQHALQVRWGVCRLISFPIPWLPAVT